MCYSILFAIVTAAFAADTPVINPGGVVNSAGVPSVQAIAPGGLVSIFGSNLAAAMTLSDSVPLSTKVGDVSVRSRRGRADPVREPQPDQCASAVGRASVGFRGRGQVVVTNAGTASAAAAVTVASSAPAIYSIGGQAIAINADGSLARPRIRFPASRHVRQRSAIAPGS